MPAPLHIVVAIIKNQQNQVLVSFREKHQHQGGLWEFPGGKVEAGETASQALYREINEELGIQILSSQLFRQIEHDYGDRLVRLDFYLVDQFAGEAEGREGQKIAWQGIACLDSRVFPKANHSIIQALKLPDSYMISGAFDSISDFIERLKYSLQQRRSIVQLRAKSLTQSQLIELVKQAHPICQAFKVPLLVNTDVEVFKQCQAEGLHLSSQQLKHYSKRPISEEKLLSVSCHNVQEIQQAIKLNVDMLLLSPVKETSSHPGVEGMGWEVFSELIVKLDIPVYALGGMQLSDMDKAKKSGAQGIAAISSLWLKRD